ncbi:low temperature requirement A [Purpureocillium lavendulum]|uniref:Low temperature requirement A n=1 Tax=Purpureocillium lavendulum TaxID=1247861 RepID=A0AB34FBF6_9HYPO|nr:low temperature requirement A [Purpureocillium lavendulum]
MQHHNHHQQHHYHSKLRLFTGPLCLWYGTNSYRNIAKRQAELTIKSARVTRAVQLGVLVGFAVVVPKFDPTDQHHDTMRAMSIILMVSRACLTIEYASTLWHVRKCKKTSLLYLQVALHAAASAVYLGITFGFKQGAGSRIYMTWYFISGAEAIGSIILSNLTPVLALTQTHLMKRMTLLTVMIMGDGMIQVAKDVVTIVKNPGAWDSRTISLLTASVATIYFILLIYFDWMRSTFYLPPLRQQFWASLHLPFHLALVLFMQAFTQYLIWSKIVTQYNRVLDISSLSHDDPDANVTSTGAAIRDGLNASIQLFFTDYPPKIAGTLDTVNNALNNITKIPESVWGQILNSSGFNLDPPSNLPDVQEWTSMLTSAIRILFLSMANALFAAFGINLDSDIADKEPNKDVKGGGYQKLVHDKTWGRYRLVFAYGYIAAGCTIFFMTVLAIVSRTTHLKIWPITRFAIILLLALGTGLVSVIWFSGDTLQMFLASAWVIPTITFVWAIILIATHINGESAERNAVRFTRGQSGNSPHTPPQALIQSLPESGHRDKYAADAHDAEAQHRPQSRKHRMLPDPRNDRQGAAPTIAPGFGMMDPRPRSSYDLSGDEEIVMKCGL